MTEKGALRRMLLAARRAMVEPQRGAANTALAKNVEARLRAHAVRHLGVFWPIQGEPDLRPLYALLAQAGIALALPVVIGKDQPLAFSVWQPGDEMVTDAFGVPTPANPRFVPLPPALLIPCVGFTAEHFRLGYGGGFYDRTLAREPCPLTIGIAYACQQAAFAIGPHDIALDEIVTELPPPA
ncbi:MAG: 5-formyltetrahydrofolate cyclo-ligase [Burkholderiaceae bacterium]|nr:5-formyltetrahydrofolate cyclo-ligase [Burkholderiaceae bacterium]